MDAFTSEVIGSSSEEELIPAVVSALFLYAEAQQILVEQSSASEPGSEANNANELELKKTSDSMTSVISAVFFTYQKVGRASDFFNLVLSRLEQASEFEKSITFGPILLKALAEGMTLSVEEEPDKEDLTENIYVATVGRNNVGKGVVTKYLKERYGFRAYPLSDRVREISLAHGFSPPHNRDTLIRVGKRVKEVFNAAILMRYAIALFSRDSSQNLLLFDGLRVEGEAEGLKELESDNTKTVCLSIVTGEENEDDDLKERYRRALGRGGSKDPQEDTEEAFKEFRKLDAREADGIKGAMKHADHEIVNESGNLEKTLAQVDKIMLNLGVKPVEEQSFSLAKENLPESSTIQYIGNVSDHVRLFNSPQNNDFDNIYAVVIDTDGVPNLVHLLSTTSDDIAEAVKEMIREKNPLAKIREVEKLNDLILIVEHAKNELANYFFEMGDDDLLGIDGVYGAIFLDPSQGPIRIIGAIEGKRKKARNARDSVINFINEQRKRLGKSKLEFEKPRLQGGLSPMTTWILIATVPN